jgi:hypothetical protein
LEEGDGGLSTTIGRVEAEGGGGSSAAVKVPATTSRLKRWLPMGMGLSELQSTVIASGVAAEHRLRVESTMAMVAVAPFDQLVQNDGEESGKIPRHPYRFLLSVLISLSLSLSLVGQC